ncbi:MAG: hypothetical protein O3B41_06755 [Bacteroidetes bacterium]|nr:hypothetical protein [Bacteroidota bacterium]
MTPSIPRFSSVKTLLNGLFDYAGLFPPAALPLEAAWQEYLGHRSSADAWMMGPFVVPIGRLNELAVLLNKTPKQGPFSFDVLPRIASTVDSLPVILTEDLNQCAEFVRNQGGRAAIDAFEFRFPAQTFSDASLAVQTVAAVSHVFEASEFGTASVFGEIVRSASFSDQVPLFFMALASSTFRQKIFGKIRCGGMDPTDFPTVDELACFIHTAIQMRYPFKATAGLHHPIRHICANQKDLMHGFINVLFATTLGRVHELKVHEISKILDDQNSDSFVFTPSGIFWKDLSASNTDFIADRRSLSLSIGSCSLNEPRADLLNLGWLSK